jgi:cellulose synthase/poly-beta-1,6-N-acetylglucosamine synthase-like glycosyltransferase
MGTVDPVLLLYLFTGVCVLYATLVSVFFAVLPKHRTGQRLADASILDHLTMVLPFKNEQFHLDALKKHYSDFPCRLVMVNDHSTDITPEALKALYASSPIDVLHLPAGSHGKKAALHFGIAHCNTEWVLTTDADTRLSRLWLHTLSFDGRKEQAYVLPVMPKVRETGIGSFFDLEFMALQGVGLATAKLGVPLLANGAAFLFRKEAYLTSLPSRNDMEIPGGDDVFTLHAIADFYGKESVNVLANFGPAAVTIFPKSSSDLWRQRVRWISKVPQVNNLAYSIISWLVLFTNVAQLAIYTGLLCFPAMHVWLVPLGVKLSADLLILAWGVSYFRRLDCLWWIFPGVLFYPIYFLALVTHATLIKPSWK